MNDVITENEISKENLNKIYYNTLLSIKSNLNKISISKDKKVNGGEEISTGTIYTDGSVNQSSPSPINSFTIEVTKNQTTGLWTSFNYSISIRTNRGRYFTFNKNQKKITEIYKTLDDIENQKNKKRESEDISSLIEGISTTVDKSFKRDDRINEILSKDSA